MSGYYSYTLKYSNGNQTVLYLDGVDNGSKTIGTYSTLVGLPALGGIGNRAIGSRAFDYPISRLVVYSSALSDANISSISSIVKEGL